MNIKALGLFVAAITSLLVRQVNSQTTNIKIFGRAATNNPTKESVDLRTILSSLPSLSVDVELSSLPEDEYRADLKLRLDRGDDYDIYMVEQSWTTSLADSHFVDILGLDTQKTVATAVSGQIPQSLDLGYYNAKLVALPFWTDFGALYYRTDVLSTLKADVPKTWNDVESICKQYLTTPAAKNGSGPSECFIAGFKNQSAVYSASEWLFSSSNNPLVGGGLTFNFDDPDFASILTQIRNWTVTGIIPTTAALQSADDAAQDWFNGKALFFQGRASHFSRSNTSGALTNKWNITALPGKTASMSASTISGYHLAISANSQNKQAALAVLTFLNSEKVQEQRAQTYGLPSSWSSYVGTANNDTKCANLIPCNLIRSIVTSSNQLQILPAKKVGSLWLAISDSLARDLLTFFATPAINAKDGLALAGKNVQAILDAASSKSVSTTSPTATTQPTNTPQNTPASTTNTPTVMIISVVVALLVFFAIVIATLIMQRKNGKWPFNTPMDKSDENALDAYANSNQQHFQNIRGGSHADMYAMDGSSPIMKSPATAHMGTVNGKYSWEAASAPRTGTVLHSQKSYAFASDYDANPIPSLPRGNTVESTYASFSNPLPPPLPVTNTAPPRTPSVLGSEYGSGGGSLVRGGGAGPIMALPGMGFMGSSTMGSSAGSVRNLTTATAVPIVDSMGRRHTVVYPYEPVQTDEMALKPGDSVLLKTAYDDGYAYGEIEALDGTVKSGVFPLACLIPNGGSLGDSITRPLTPPAATAQLINSTQNNNNNNTAASILSATSSVSNMNATSPVPQTSASRSMTSSSLKVQETPEALLMTGRLTEETYLRIRNEKKEREERQIAALKERLARPDLPEVDRERLQRRLDELELGV
ncbi:hypothetical protein HDU97_007380 [Phlyctochytrium planicorne]|nr:hypothetical protein HDU97_007380 [Phlyctochytrium planicorne]